MKCELYYQAGSHYVQVASHSSQQPGGGVSLLTREYHKVMIEEWEKEGGNTLLGNTAATQWPMIRPPEGSLEEQ